MTNDITDPYADAKAAAAAIRDRFGIDRLDIGLVLGSGWKSGSTSSASRSRSARSRRSPASCRPWSPATAAS